MGPGAGGLEAGAAEWGQVGGRTSIEGWDRGGGGVSEREVGTSSLLLVDPLIN